MNEFVETQCYSPVFDIAAAALLIFAAVWLWRHLPDTISGRKSSVGYVSRYNRTATGSLGKRVFYPLLVIPVASLVLYFMSERLYTRIDDTGIHYRMFPAQWSKRNIAWSEVSRIEIKGYIMYSGKTSAYDVYSIYDKYGLYLWLRDGRRLIIGTKRPEEMLKALHLSGR